MLDCDSRVRGAWGRVYRSQIGHFALYLLFLSHCNLALAGPPQINYHLLKRITLGGGKDGRDYFDYMTVDAAARRLYLSHFTQVEVIDTDTFKNIGHIYGMQWYMVSL